MAFLLGLHGPPAIAILCALLFVQETGIPVPLLSGNVIFTAGGLLAASGTIPWLFLPPAIVCVVAGAIVGHWWARRWGEPVVRRVARRIGLERYLGMVSERLQTAGPMGIAVCRLTPGFRITTTLAAGALQVERGVFVMGLVPAVLIWSLGYTVLGAEFGRGAIAVMHHIDNAALPVAATCAVVVILGIVGYRVARSRI